MFATLLTHCQGCSRPRQLTTYSSNNQPLRLVHKALRTCQHVARRLQRQLEALPHAVAVHQGRAQLREVASEGLSPAHTHTHTHSAFNRVSELRQEMGLAGEWVWLRACQRRQSFASERGEGGREGGLCECEGGSAAVSHPHISRPARVRPGWPQVKPFCGHK